MVKLFPLNWSSQHSQIALGTMMIRKGLNPEVLMIYLHLMCLKTTYVVAAVMYHSEANKRTSAL